MTAARLALAAALLLGCRTAAPLPVACDPRALDAHLGAVVTLVGVQTRTKQPTVCGADVDGDYALSDRTVRVTGVLHRTIVNRPEPKPGDEMVATRGSGTYYDVTDPKTGALARPVAEPN